MTEQGFPPDRAFPSVPIPGRAPKPRTKGLTITVEFGVGPAAQRDYLELASDTMDYAKHVVSTPGLMPERVLRKKNEIYAEYGIKPFPGGMFLEYALAGGLVAEYIQGARDAGYGVLEVSENARGIGPDARADLVRRCLDSGFEVLGEVGSKHSKSSPAEVVDGIGQLMDLGCSKVLVEAAELMCDGRVDEALVRQIEQTVDIDDCVFELPGPWIPGTHHHDVIALQMWLLGRFGPDVNIANDLWGNSLYLESCRRRIGANLFEPGPAPIGATSGGTGILS